ncbi:OmpA family protein [Ferruginibacter sp.]|uniref:OmpA family protein n=1 Tax=Ferruginibacter sp. TaxID=1940288 RepID=UPI002659E48D|nr:OmpA family protein [Ferruginibacter sp.]
MPKQYFYLLMALTMPVAIFAQSSPAAPMNLPKDAPVNVSIADAKSGNLLSNEIVVFKSRANGTEFQGLSDSTGKFTVRLPNGTKYDIYILGFHDSTSYNVLDIPAIKDNQYYKNPFNVDIQFEAPKSFVLDNCTFETGKATLQPEAYKVVDELVEYLKRKEDEKIEVGGHTDNVGKPEANMILSTNRANTVRAYLLTKGIAPDRVTSKGYGITVPIAENDTAEGRALNRRTEVKIIE